MAGQTISDRLLAAKHSIAGQGLAKSVCKATTEELLGPKKKHLDYLIHCTNEPNVSIPQLANLLIERSQNTNWVVVFKALITVHHLMCYGNERFTQYLASSNSTFQLSNFLDKSGVQGYDMSPFIRRYARYLNEKALSYRTVAFDFCKVKRGKEDGVLRTMNSDKLLKTLPVLQSQLDALLEFDCTAADLANAVISMAFMLLFRDLIRLFAGYNDSIINLLEYSLKELLLRLKMDFKVDGDRRTGEECEEYDAMFQISKYTEQVGVGETKGSSSSATESSAWEITSTSTGVGRYTSSSEEDKEDEMNEAEYVIGKEFAVEEPSTNLNWNKNTSLSTCTSDVVQVKQETDPWTYEAMRQSDFDNFIENKFRCMETKLCKRCCPKDCFEAFKNVYKQKYFEMNKKQCREALDLYKKFLIRMDRVGEFLKVAENVGIDKGEIPDLTKAPSSLLDALEQHLAALEGKKSVVNTPTQAATQQRTDVRSGVSALTSTSSSFGTAAQQSEIVDETTARQALAEEEAILNQYKQAKVQSPVSSIPNANSNANTATTNPFLSSPTQPIVDLFSAPVAPAASKNTNQTKASDDLLQLGNPFADMFGQPAAPVPAATAFNNNVSNNNIWMTNGFSNIKPSLTNAFVDDRSFTSVFGDTNTTSSSTTTTAASDGSIPSSGTIPFSSDREDAGDLSGLAGESEEARNLRAGMAPPPPRPPPPASGQPVAGTKTALDDLNDSIRVAMGSPSRPPPPASSQQPIPVIPGGVPGAQPILGYPPLQQQLYGSPVKFPPGPPGSVAACPTSTGTSKVITGDLESSIASLAENLTINKTSTQTKPIQWNSPAKSGNNAQSWTPQPMAATTGVNYRPMVQGMPPTNPATTFPAAYSMGMPNMPAARMAVPPYNNVAMMNQPQQPIVPPQAQQATTLDPFGAL